MRLKMLSPFFALFLFVLVLALSAAAQDQVEPTPTYEPIEPVSPPPSDTSDAPTLPPLEITIQATLNPLETTPVSEISATETSRPQVEGTVGAVDVIPEEGPKPNEFPTDFTTLFADDFEGVSANWINDTAAQVVPSPQGHALNVSSPFGHAETVLGGIGDLVLEMSIHIEQGQAFIHIRQSEHGKYLLSLAADGTIALWRNDLLLAAGQASSRLDDRWSFVVVKAVGGDLQVIVDNTPVISAVDPDSLPMGLLRLTGDPVGTGSYQIDHILIQIPAAESMSGFLEASLNLTCHNATSSLQSYPFGRIVYPAYGQGMTHMEPDGSDPQLWSNANGGMPKPLLKGNPRTRDGWDGQECSVES